MTKTTYGLVLSGGGVRGMAHIGVIRALEENGIYPEYIAGASIGAIVGAFYAAGSTCDEILEFFLNTSMFSVNKYAIRKPGLLDTEKFYKIFKKHFEEDRFEALKKRLFISTTDIVEGKNKIFNTGELIYPMLASAAFPVVLSPIEIDGVLYADGGITNNFPVEPLIPHCSHIIGSYTNPLSKIKPNELSSSMSVMDRAFKIGMTSMSARKFQHCHLVISPEKLNSYGTFSMNHIQELHEIGYQEALQTLK
jgi:NTE family protein